MKKINEKLSDIFDVEPIQIETPKTELPVVTVPSSDNSVEVDTEIARQNIKDLINKGSSAINELAVVARDSQQPRAYEVMATMLKNLSDLNKDLLELQKRKKDLVVSSNKNNSNDVNIDKAVFVGSTAELMKVLKTNK